jgi:histidinol-phosphatase (PHP family)
MKLPADYHMHTPLCRHAAGEPVEYARKAVEVGLAEIGFSDHSPMREDGFDDWRMNLRDLQSYIQKVQHARREFPMLRIKIGLEVDYLPGHEAWIKELAAMHPWDYLIGSVHYIGNWALDNPYDMSEWKRREAWDVWSDYFDRLTMAAESELFDIIGHADLCKKFRFYPDRDCTPLYERFLRAAAKAGCAIELNTAGLRKDCREIYPNLGFLKLAQAAGVPITFGSDAHAPEEVGADFRPAVEHAKAAGYQQAVRLTQRRTEMVKL